MMRSLPDEALLAEYAAGSLPAGLSLLVASQLTFNPEGRRRVAELERLGGALLASDPAGAAEAAAAPSLEAMLARLDREGPRAEGARPAAVPPPADPGNPFPAPLRAVLSQSGVETPQDVAWKRLLPGLAEHIIEGVGDEHEEVSLLRARPGAPIFAHTHTGVETTLVLCGLMEDRGRTLGRGDVAIATDHDDHRPRIVGDETCICLVVMTGEMRFTGRLSRVLNYLS
ncbi:ChrR family anti-sigma-E factor [Albimonas sp. CAU 1670]|uniref:ChrR family anti-sigma-E factor n=1 Tax=Albimonas sp. CAU 1670 TaxID=3032599 RepID=UPI0023D98D0E|nr:ChrR family anti-sigma-E factor [Albimonas sp. CAU 1670]MDF2231339.1 ChrR family anti-sigma-E factor [Albimonas sp. CAU 1670]